MSKFTLLNHVIDASFINIEMIWVGMRSPMVKKLLGESVPQSFCECLDYNTLKYFQNKREAKRFSDICAQAITYDKKLLDKITKKTEFLADKILELNISQFNFSKLSNKEILSLLKKIHSLQSQISSWGMPIAFADIGGNISNKLSKILSKRVNLKHPYDLYSEVLSSPDKISLTQKAYQAILKSNNYSYLQKKYFWLDQGYVGLGLGQKDIKEIKKTQKIKKAKKIISKKDLISELSLSPNEINFFETSASMVYLKALRGDCRQVLHVLVNHIIKEIAKRHHLESKFLHMLSSYELMNFLKNEKNLPENLNKRLKHCLVVPVNKNEYKIITQSKQINQFLKTKIETNKQKFNNNISLSGQVAQAGKIKGKACMVLSAKDNSKIKPGEILVSISTSPQLLPAMKKAAAFLTEMGGITSHASIVSRELKKPCIVGIKSITQTLKDGDLIEVDANLGRVKIIKRK
jgi:phosphoenolpyruvate synthase/pyruvate phosphate dikinase